MTAAWLPRVWQVQSVFGFFLSLMGLNLLLALLWVPFVLGPQV